MPSKSMKANEQDFPASSYNNATRTLVTRSAHTFAIIGIVACFVAWASLFVYRSSFVAIDGRRYFSLIDDAMISMRYAWNLSHGFGPVWNPGEYVEGYTNPLMTLLMSLPTLVFDKVDAVLAVQVLGILFMLANAYLMMVIAGQLVSGWEERYRRLFLVLAFLCALSYYPLLYWSLMGMETGLLAVLLSLSVLYVLRYARDHRPAQGVLLSVSLGLAFLTRPDAVIFAVPAFAYAFWVTRKSGRKPSLSFLLAMVGLYALFIVGQELFRWGYYGEWLPNTYTLKVDGIPLLARLVNGIGFIGPFLKEVWLLLIVVGAGLIFAFRRDKLFLVSIFVVLVCYQVWVGGEPGNYWRLLSPAMPIMLLVGTREVVMALQSASDTDGVRRYFLRNSILPRWHIPEFLVCLLVLVMVWSVNYRFSSEIAMLRTPYEVELNVNRVNTALAIDQVTTPNATVGVFAAGIIPYYTGRPAIDFFGKSDRYIARLAPELSDSVHGLCCFYTPGHNKYDSEYSIKELTPTYVEGFFAWSEQNVTEWAEAEYVKVDYEGVPLHLLKSSRDVRWEETQAPPEAVDKESL